MTTEAEVIEMTRVLFAAEGHHKHLEIGVAPQTTVSEFSRMAATACGFAEEVEVSLEDADGPLQGDLVLIAHLSVSFSPLHVARPGEINVVVNYQARSVERHFRKNATIAKVTKWAIGPHGLAVEGVPTDYQIKFNGEIESPDQHIGQIAHNPSTLCLDLVFKVKPQGWCDATR